MQTSAHGVKDMLDAADVAEMMDMDDEVGGPKLETKLVSLSAHPHSVFQIQSFLQPDRTPSRLQRISRTSIGLRDLFCNTC